jgi:hypothetical protein
MLPGLGSCGFSGRICWASLQNPRRGTGGGLQPEVSIFIDYLHQRAFNTLELLQIIWIFY